MGTHPIFESDFDCLTDLRLMKLFAAFAFFQITVSGTSIRTPEPKCSNNSLKDCKHECYDEYADCRSAGLSLEDCDSDMLDCHDMCVCIETHFEYRHIKHPVRSCPPPRSNSCDFVKQTRTVSPNWFRHSEWSCKYECLNEN